MFVLALVYSLSICHPGLRIVYYLFFMLQLFSCRNRLPELLPLYCLERVDDRVCHHARDHPGGRLPFRFRRPETDLYRRFDPFVPSFRSIFFINRVRGRVGFFY